MAVIIALVAIVAVVLIYARVGRLHGDTYHVRMLTDAARGVIKGTDVWLAGQKVGIVSDIQFMPPAQDTMQRLLIELQLLERARDLVREDSYAQIRSGGSLIGSPVVYLTVGTPATPRLQEDDTVKAKPQVDTEGLTSAVATAGKQFPEIIRQAKELREDMRSATSRLTRLQDDGGVTIDGVGSRAAGLTRRATRGTGTIPLLMRDRAVGARVSSAMQSADTLRALMASESRSLGRFTKDSTLVREIAALRDEVSILRALIDQAEGTAGRAVKDRAVMEALASVERELTQTIDDLKRDPLRYVNF